MKKLCTLSTILGIGLLAFGVTLVLRAQAPALGTTANQDIQKMIQAGLPESVILNKIREGAGRWDTSVDALIALKKAGATEAELSALSVAQVIAPQTQPAAATSSGPVELFGGMLMRTRAGDPYVQFPSTAPGIFPDGRPANTAYLTVYHNEPAFLLPSTMIIDGVFCLPGNLLVTQSRVLFDPYVEGCGENSKARSLEALYSFKGLDKGKSREEFGDRPMEYSYEEFRSTKVSKDDGLGLFGNIDILSKFKSAKFPIGYLIGDYPFFDQFSDFGKKSDISAFRSALPKIFVEDLLRDFKGQLAQFEQAAGISDPASQLSAAAHYQPVTPELSARYMAILQQRLDERTKSSGNGWMSAMNALQGVANIQQSMQDAKAADLTHNTAGQMRAVANGTTAEMQTLGAVSGNTTIIQPLAPASSTQTQPTAAQSTVAVSVQAAQPQTYTKTYTTTQNNGDLVKQTIFAGAPGAQITIQCFAPGQTQPYKTQTFTHSSSSEFFTNLPPVCTRTASATAPPSSGTGTGTAKPPVPYTPAPSSGGTVVATNGTICPPSGWIMHQTGDVSVGEQCTPGQPISSTTSSSGSGGSGAGNGGDSGGSSLRYVDALSTSCISMDFNANYHWDEYMNNCGVVLSLTYVFPNGTAGTFDHLSPGKPEGSGHSRADYQADGGNPSLYACPVDSHPVDVNGNNFYKPVAQFRCMKL